jgi:hypothetical protein
MAECGICGIEPSTMDKATYGVACICENKSKAGEISSAGIGENRRNVNNYGWSGTYE